MKKINKQHNKNKRLIKNVQISKIENILKVKENHNTKIWLFQKYNKIDKCLGGHMYDIYMAYIHIHVFMCVCVYILYVYNINYYICI